MSPVVRKMPEPMTVPITIRIAEPSPMARMSPSSGACTCSWTCIAFPLPGPPNFIPLRGLKFAAEDRTAARLTTYLVVSIVAATLIAGLIVGAQRDDDDGPVDLIVHNATPYTADRRGATTGGRARLARPTHL